ncbi:cobalt-precorrin 5A hydrolase [uncultured bacterium]|nr:cobalt-precorrin 5A hydrolase [uncultured bacterium]
MKGRDKINSAAVFALTERGAGLAAKIAAAIGPAEVFNPAALANGGLKKEAAKAFKGSEALVFISATGIAIRSVAPLLKGKHLDPAIVVVDERGRFSISLLSGHMGGANKLAGVVAKAIGATPVITTATDVWGLPSAEELAGSFSLVIEDPKKIKAVNSAILERAKVFVVDGNAARRKETAKRFKGVFTCRRALPKKPGPKDACIVISSRVEPIPPELAGRTLVLRPREIAVGVGCGKGVPKAMIKKALVETFAAARLSTLSIRNFATIDIKKNEKGLKALAKELGVPIEVYSAAGLNRVNGPFLLSSAVMKATGARAVAEPSAIISSGAKKLCIRKTKTGHVTIAAALIPSR